MTDSFIGSTPTDGYGDFTYKWISSENGKDSIYTDAIGVNNLVNYLSWYIKQNNLVQANSIFRSNN